jgi:hypothetical protein
MGADDYPNVGAERDRNEMKAQWLQPLTTAECAFEISACWIYRSEALESYSDDGDSLRISRVQHQ